MQYPLLNSYMLLYGMKEIITNILYLTQKFYLNLSMPTIILYFPKEITVELSLCLFET